MSIWDTARIIQIQEDKTCRLEGELDALYASINAAVEEIDKKSRNKNQSFKFSCGLRTAVIILLKHGLIPEKEE